MDTNSLTLVQSETDANVFYWRNGSINEKTIRQASTNKYHTKMFQHKQQQQREDEQKYSNEDRGNHNQYNDAYTLSLEENDGLTPAVDNSYLASIHSNENGGKNEVLTLIQSQGFVKKNNKRDGQNERLSSRHMMIQKGVSPFIDPSDYVKHLDAETEYLRPRDSNYIE